MTLSELQHLLERAAAVKIAVVGDLMLDRYVYGAVEPRFAGSADPGDEPRP